MFALEPPPLTTLAQLNDMKKSVEPEKRENPVTFNTLVALMSRKVEWDNLSEKQKNAFRDVFLDDRCFQDFCRRLFYGHHYYSEAEGKVLSQIYNNSRQVSDREYYDFILERELWDPFQIMYASDFIILPHKKPRALDFEFDRFFSLKYKGDNDIRNLKNGIRIARLLQTYICEDSFRKEYSVEISKSIIHPKKSYAIHYSPQRYAFIVSYGMGLDTRYYPEVDDLLYFLIHDIQELRSSILHNLPDTRGQQIVESIRVNECLSNKSETISRVLSVPRACYPFRVSGGHPYPNDHYSYSKNNLPFVIKTNY